MLFLIACPQLNISCHCAIFSLAPILSHSLPLTFQHSRADQTVKGEVKDQNGETQRKRKALFMTHLPRGPWAAPRVLWSLLGQPRSLASTLLSVVTATVSPPQSHSPSAGLCGSLLTPMLVISVTFIVFKDIFPLPFSLLLPVGSSPNLLGFH